MKIIQDYATRDDFKKLDSRITKLDSRITKLDSRITKLDSRITKLDSRITEYKDEILNGLDKVMGELQAMREDNTIGIHQTRALREDVDGHEKRITKLEATTS